MRVLIIGLGAAGAMAAWRLAKQGHEVVGIERFKRDHDQGSSFGDSRIVRRVYPDPFYTTLMRDSYSLWDELMIDSNQPNLFSQCGGIFVGSKDHPHLMQAKAALSQSGVPFEELGAQACKERFPAFPLQANETALYEPSMGYARASLSVKAALQCAEKFGAVFHEETVVERVEKRGERIRACDSDGKIYEADRLLLTPGPWIAPMLAQFGVRIPVKVTRQVYLHLEPKLLFASEFEENRFPVWIDAEANAYGFPKLGALPGVKIGMHDFGEETDPSVARRSINENDIAPILRYSMRRFPKLTEKILYEKLCLYTTTADEDFIVDGIPGIEGAFFISACSGHGFKFAPLMGQIGAQLAVGGRSNYDLSRFRL